MLSQKLYLISDATFELNLPRDIVHSMNNGGVRPIESLTYGLQGLVGVFAAEVHAKIARVDNTLLARI